MDMGKLLVLLHHDVSSQKQSDYGGDAHICYFNQFCPPADLLSENLSHRYPTDANHKLSPQSESQSKKLPAALCINNALTQ